MGCGRRFWILVGVWLLSISPALCGSAPSDGETARIQQHVDATPPAATASVKALADYLAAPSASELQRTQAIYQWIIRNIDYDTEALAAGDPGDQSAEAVLAKRKAVCSGYSRLFLALARSAGLEAVEVVGYSRGAGYVPGSPVGPEPDHAWTAVKLGGGWQLIDCTWAAGYLDGGSFVRRPDDYYFLTPPDRFIYDHLPEDPKWQLTAAPIAKEEFERLVYLRPGFFRCGLSVVSHPQIEIVSDGALTVTFGGPEDALLRARVGEGESRDDVAQTFVQRDGEQLKLNTSFPRAGVYTLRVYAKKRGDTGPYDWAADYLVRVPELKASPASYPEVMATFQETSSRLFSPVTGVLRTGAQEEFKLTVPGAEAVAVVMGGDWSKLEKHDDFWEGKLAIKGDEAQVAAKFPGSASFYILLSYRVSGAGG